MKLEDDEAQLQEDQSAEPLLQITNCDSGSKTDPSVAVLESESGGIRSFFPSVMDKWVRYYVNLMGDPCINNSHSTLRSYIEHMALPSKCDFMMQAHIASILIMLMRSNRDLFRQFTVNIIGPIVKPKWHFSMFSEFDILSDRTAYFSDRNQYLITESDSMKLAFYRLIETTYTFNYKGIRMFTVNVSEPEKCLVRIYDIARVEIEGYGKYDCWYFIGDLYALLYKDLFAHIIEVAWHPDRCFKWCFAHDNQTIQYEKYKYEAKQLFYKLEVSDKVKKLI